MALLLAAWLALTSCGGGVGDDFDADEETLGQTATQAPSPTNTPSPQATASASVPIPASPSVSPSPTTVPEPGTTPEMVAPGDDLPRLTTQVDILFTDLTTGELAFEVVVEARFGNSPQGSIVPFDESRDLRQMVRENLQWLLDRGYNEIEIYGIEGYGELFVDSEVLASLRRERFDYDSQYNGDPADGELAVDEEEAFGRYYSVGNPLPMVLEEAHSLGFKVAVLIESLAHIINRATESGIGGSGLVLSGNLAPPSIDQVLAFVDEVIAAGADAISAEAFSIEYDTAIANHLSAVGIPYLHTGADLGTVWQGYYYSFYPDDEKVRDVYTFVHSDDAVFGTTNGTIYARARALSPQPETSVVVGAYNPIPCDTNLSLADVYSDKRALPIDDVTPALADGTLVENCAAATWLNLLTVAARRQDVDRILLTADLPASIAAASQTGVANQILQRIAAHPAPDVALPIANIILERPHFTEDDGFLSEDFFDYVSVAVVGTVNDALEAQGYQTVLTYDLPWDGGVSELTYILTAGGNEDTEDGIGMGPPYWSNAQDLGTELAALLDPANHSGPVFVHPIFGLPDSGRWQRVRDQFHLPSRFAFRNQALSQYEEYHTSLLTSIPLTAEGDVDETKTATPVIPTTGTVLGHTMNLSTFSDFYGLGQLANLATMNEVQSGQAFASGPMLVPTGGGGREEQVAPYLLTDGVGRFLWLVNQLHHEAFTFIVGQAIAGATGQPAVLAEPMKAHVWSGSQTFVLAYDRTEVHLRLPYESGQLIDITVYDLRSRPVSKIRATPYFESVTGTLDKYSLMVIEPAR